MSRHIILVAAGVLSLCVHFAIAGAWPNKEKILVGGDVAGKVALGNSFADLVAGTMQSAAPDGEITPTSAVAQTEPEQPTDKAASAVETTTQPVSADTSTTASAAPSITPPTQEAVQHSTTPTNASTSALAVVQPNTSTDVISPSEAREPVTVTSSIRPVSRPSPTQSVQPATDTPETAQARRGNAEVNAVAGQQTGAQGGSVTQSSAAQQTTAAQVGQGAIDSYKSSVASRVIRVAERMRSRGTQGNVVVGMQISANGTLAGATIVQSSGDASADAIALNAIRRAAPFEPTPTRQSISVAFRVQLVPG